MENKNLAISFILIVIGMILLFSNNDIAYSNSVLVIGGILFYRGIYMLTEFLWKK